MHQIRTLISIWNCLESESGPPTFIAFECALVTWFQDSGNKIFELPGLSVFSHTLHRMTFMIWIVSGTISRQRSLWRIYLLGLAFLASSLTLLADTPALLRTVPADGCYCHCAESHRQGGCVKMCDSKRYASRWRATKCAKPRMRTPADNSNAGPRFPHPGRAEHAKLRQ